MTKSERTRQFIIETSAPIFNTKGIAATAYSDVMQATKMAKGGLYGLSWSKKYNRRSAQPSPQKINCLPGWTLSNPRRSFPSKEAAHY